MLGLVVRSRWLRVCVYSCAVLVNNIIHFIVVKSYCTDRNDHTTVTAPLPVCSAKLSTVGPG